MGINPRHWGCGGGDVLSPKCRSSRIEIWKVPSLANLRGANFFETALCSDGRAKKEIVARVRNIVLFIFLGRACTPLRMMGKLLLYSSFPY